MGDRLRAGKPPGYVTGYTQANSVSYLSRTGNEYRPKCDWKAKTGTAHSVCGQTCGQTDERTEAHRPITHTVLAERRAVQINNFE